MWLKQRKGTAMAEQRTDQLTAANNSRNLAEAIGPTVGYHVSQCKHGGYIVVVDGAIHAACTTLAEAMAAMGRVAASQYNETAEPPERAHDVTPHGGEIDRLPRMLRPVPASPKPPDPTGVPIRQTAVLVLVAITAFAGALWGV